MKPEQDWTGQARDLLEADTRRYDAATLSRLNRARQRALLQAEPAAPRLAWARRLAVAASLLLGVAMLWPDRPVPVPTAPAPSTLSPEDAELLADGELELNDDLEFYAWLDADDEHNG